MYDIIKKFRLSGYLNMDNDNETNKSKMTAKTFVCDVCKNGFKTKSNLNVHKRIQKPYKCVVY